MLTIAKTLEVNNAVLGLLTQSTEEDFTMTPQGYMLEWEYNKLQLVFEDNGLDIDNIDKETLNDCTQSLTAFYNIANHIGLSDALAMFANRKWRNL